MSRDIDKLRDRANKGNLTKADVAYLAQREGISAFDAIRQSVDAPVFDLDDYGSWKVKELQDELDERGIEYASSDKKADLAAALTADDEDEEE